MEGMRNPSSLVSPLMVGGQRGARRWVQAVLIRKARLLRDPTRHFYARLRHKAALGGEFAVVLALFLQ